MTDGIKVKLCLIGIVLLLQFSLIYGHDITVIKYENTLYCIYEGSLELTEKNFYWLKDPDNQNSLLEKNEYDTRKINDGKKGYYISIVPTNLLLTCEIKYADNFLTRSLSYGKVTMQLITDEQTTRYEKYFGRYIEHHYSKITGQQNGNYTVCTTTPINYCYLVQDRCDIGNYKNETTDECEICGNCLIGDCDKDTGECSSNDGIQCQTGFQPPYCKSRAVIQSHGIIIYVLITALLIIISLNIIYFIIKYIRKKKTKQNNDNEPQIMQMNVENQPKKTEEPEYEEIIADTSGLGRSMPGIESTRNINSLYVETCNDIRPFPHDDDDNGYLEPCHPDINKRWII